MGIILTSRFAVNVSIISSDSRSITLSVSIIFSLGFSFDLSLRLDGGLSIGGLPLLLGWLSRPTTRTSSLGWRPTLSNALLWSGPALWLWSLSFSSIIITRTCYLNTFACTMCLKLVPELLEGGTSIFSVLLTGDASDLIEVDLRQMLAYDTVNAFHGHTRRRKPQ